MSLIKLPYLGSNIYGEILKSPSGYNEINGIDKYNNSYPRNVRIVRVDLLYYLTEHFSSETIKKYRDVLYFILAGYQSSDNNKLILESLEYIYTIDDIFKVKLGKIVYFRDTKFESLSVYNALLEDTKLSIDSVREQVVSIVPHVKIICDSHLYIYFSVSEFKQIEELIQIRGLEVVSRC